MVMKILLVFCLLFSLCHALTAKDEVLAEKYLEVFQPYRSQIKQWVDEVIIREVDPPATSTFQTRADFVTSDVCKRGFPILKTLVKLRTPTSLIIRAISKMCVWLGIEKKELCDPTVRSFAEPVIYIIKNRKNYTANDLCGILNPGSAPVNEKLVNWSIRIDQQKPPVQTRPLLPQRVQTVKIIHLTDVHMDVDYKVGTNADCGLPLCCREGMPTNPENAAGKYGHYKCSLPPLALNEILSNARQAHGPIKFVFLTGDYVHSGIWLYSQKENSRNIMAVMEAVAGAFPNTPVYPLVGNHEPDVVNMYPPQELWNRFDLSWMYNNVSKPFERWLGQEQLATFKTGGYYTVVPEPGLRLVVLNTNICYVSNFWLAYDPVDPNNQLQWLADVMLQAERERQNVYIVGHVKPGSGSCWPVWSKQFNAIVNRFENIIRGQFYGHAHKESFTIAFEQGTDRPLDGAIYNAPSALTDRMNSGYKVYHVDGARGKRSTWEVVDHETWILNTTRSNAQGQPVLEKLFSAKQEYGLKSLRGAALYDFLLRMIGDDDLFLKFQRNHVKGLTTRALCDRSAPNFQDCKMGLLCECVKADSGDNSHCDRLKGIRNSNMLAHNQSLV